MVRERGNATNAQIETFFAAGYSHRAVLDVILGIAQKTMSNYVNHVAVTPVDEVFQPLAWRRSDTPLIV
jgi:alkylhydroperoxidase family enzyme